MKYFIILLLPSLSLFAQDEDLDQLPYDDTPPEPERPTYFAIAVGYTLNFYFVDMSEINSILGPDQFNIESLSSPMTLHGGGGFTGFPIWKNVRLGLFGMSGTRSTEELISDDVHKQANLHLSVSGLHADYGYVLSNNIALLGGLGIGYGNMDVEILQSVGVKEWDNIKDIPDAENFNLSLDHSFLQVQPQLSIEWAATNFLMIRGNVHYNLTFNNIFSDKADWTVNQIGEINNAPSGLNANAFAAQVGIFIGLFNY